ncbi:Uncharacterised protein [Escherichia coli]|nr:Uncharacterised protein [Escherichia coli]
MVSERQKKTAEHVGGFLTYKLTDYISGIAKRTILISGCGHTPQHQYQQCRNQHHDTARAVLPV